MTLTFALISKDLGWVTVLLAVLVAYAILSIDLHRLGAPEPVRDPQPRCPSPGRYLPDNRDDLLGLLADEGRLTGEEEPIHDLGTEGLGDPDRSIGIAGSGVDIRIRLPMIAFGSRSGGSLRVLDDERPHRGSRDGSRQTTFTKREPSRWSPWNHFAIRDGWSRGLALPAGRIHAGPRSRRTDPTARIRLAAGWLRRFVHEVVTVNPVTRDALTNIQIFLIELALDCVDWDALARDSRFRRLDWSHARLTAP